MGSRRKAREKALQILFQLDFDGADIESICSEFWKTHPVGEKTRDFAEELVRGTIAMHESIDEMITSTVANWSIDRLTSIDRTILRFATYELMYMPEVPPKVTINEAIEIGKTFGTDESGGFINGVLDKIRGRLEESAEPANLPETGKSKDE